MTEEQAPYTPEQIQTAIRLCGNHTHAGNIRLVATFIAETQKACDGLVAEAEHTLNDFRSALEVPPGSGEEDMLKAIAQLKERAGIGVAHDGRICPCPVCTELRARKALRVWHDDKAAYAIAWSRLDLAVVLEDTFGESTSPDGWFELAPAATIKIKVFLASGEIAPADEEGPHIDTLTLSASEWAKRVGRGFLCTNEY